MANSLFRALSKYSKPILIAETASSEVDGNPLLKALWIEKLSQYVKNNPEIKGVVWFNTTDNGIDWSITTSRPSFEAFKTNFSDSYFVSRISASRPPTIQNKNIACYNLPLN